MLGVMNGEKLAEHKDAWKEIVGAAISQYY